MIHLEPQTAQMFSRALGALKPPPNLTLSQWADSYRRLSAEASAAQGRWNTDNAPFQREIMDAIGDVHIRKVVAMMCAQSGKTDGLILNTIGYYMSYYPAPTARRTLPFRMPAAHTRLPISSGWAAL